MTMWTISYTQFVKIYLFPVTISEVQSKEIIVNYLQEIHYAVLLCTTQDTGKDSYKKKNGAVSKTEILKNKQWEKINNRHCSLQR